MDNLKEDTLVKFVFTQTRVGGSSKSTETLFTWLQLHFVKLTFNLPTLFQKPVPNKNRDENKQDFFFT